MENVERTGGGDGPECYELVLKRAREELAWTAGSQRVLVVIGDNEPHPVGYKYGGKTYYIDWKEECEFLKNMVSLPNSFITLYYNNNRNMHFIKLKGLLYKKKIPSKYLL